MRTAHGLLISGLAALALLAPTAPGIQAASHARAADAMVKTNSSKILVTNKGMTLYVFALDKPNVSNCNGTCAKFWPPVTVPASMQVPTTMTGMPGKFGTTTRKDGATQLTYDGSPLYTFIKDKDASDMYGQGLFASGGFWWAVVVNKSKSSDTGGSSNNGGGGSGY
jgi:predicted lipoprotein with Yx(FWY)xxD motif